MALTRKFLSALGIDEDKAGEIIDAHIETVNALKQERDTYKADAEKLSTVQKELDDLKATTANNENPFEKQFNDLKLEYENYKQEQEAKESTSKKRDAYRTLLKEAGVSEKRIDSVLKVTDLNSIEFGSDGKIKDAKKLSDTIKTEWADFIVTEEKRGAQTSTPLSNNGGKTLTKADIMAIRDGTERRKAIAENPGLFGLPTTTNN